MSDCLLICAQIHEAKKELKARFSASTLDFLARRGKHKQDSQKNMERATQSQELIEPNPNQPAQTKHNDPLSEDMLGNPLPRTNADAEPAFHARLRFDLDGEIVDFLSMHDWKGGQNCIQSTLERGILREVLNLLLPHLPYQKNVHSSS